MHKVLNSIVLIVAALIVGSCYGQSYFNHLYSYNVKEFNREIHLLENGDIISIGGGILDEVSMNSSRIIRKIDMEGKLFWADHVSHEIYGLFSEWTHTSTIVNDSLLILTGTARIWEESLLIYKPYFLKYNLNTQNLIQLQFYDLSDFHIHIYSTILHIDGYIYCGGKEYLDNARDKADLVILKLDINGRLIWKRNIDKAEKEKVCEIDSYGANLIVTGQDSSGDTKTYISIIDTSANILQHIYSEPFASSGLTNVEIVYNEIYYATMSDKELKDNETLYLAKFDSLLQIIWDTLVPNTSQYEISARRMEIVNDQMLILSNITDAFEYTNNRVWSHAAAWSLDGEFQWEHVYFQDSAAIHHLDDVEMLPNGDLIFMGTVFDTAGQHLWLLRTDSQGCGSIQEKCYYTLDQYFGLDTMVSILEQELATVSLIQVLGNPFGKQLLLQATMQNKQQVLDISIFNVEGLLIYEGLLSGSLSLNTTEWQTGVYVLQIKDEEKLLGVEKLVRE